MGETLGSAEDYLARLRRFRYRALWVAIAASVLGIIAIWAGALALGEGLGPIGFSTLVVFGASLAGCLYFETKRDPYLASRTLVVLAGGTIALSGLTLLLVTSAFPFREPFDILVPWTTARHTPWQTPASDAGDSHEGFLRLQLSSHSQPESEIGRWVRKAPWVI